MKSFLEMAVKSVACLLSKLWTWLKNIFQRIEKNRPLCKKILVVLAVLLAWVMGMRYGADKKTVEPEVVIKYVPVAVTEQPEQTDNMEAKMMAKVLYGMRFNNPTDLEGVAWVILNRVDSPLFPNTVEEVCKQPSQWMGYQDSNPVVDDLYKIAEKVLTEYSTDGRRLFGKDFLFFTWSQSYIVFRTEFKESSTCQYWRSY